ncbi:unnamed protein product [Pleuronectes platessa]|uniref:Uncharacterized protein n=1 Tax=Pleuronectes platessa TaxID=8262 RepID=A0A9N7THN2_PLEPL|nr:unnamed protein product [Pleuronectes platessa]
MEEKQRDGDRTTSQSELEILKRLKQSNGVSSHVGNGQKTKAVAPRRSLVRLTRPPGSAGAISVFSGPSSLQAGEVATLSTRLCGRARATHHANASGYPESRSVIAGSLGREGRACDRLQ